NDSIEKITLHMRYSLQQGIVDTSVTLTEYLCSVFVANDVARRQVLSLINEKGYEQEAANRLHEWCSCHITVLLNPTVVNNPYEVPWPTWMMKMLLEALQQVDWNKLVNSLKEKDA